MCASPLKSHDVITAIHVVNFSGHRTAQIGSQVECCSPDLRLIDVATERSSFRVRFQHISEIADAEPPHTPRGCPFQAWSLGEFLRIETLLS